MTPDIIFHRYFQTVPWRSRGYLGKHTSEGLRPQELQLFLMAIQAEVNRHLNTERHLYPV